MYEEAINRDGRARRHFVRLAYRHHVETIVETGTFHGVTTEFLASLAPSVHSIEIDWRYLEIARGRLQTLENVQLHQGNSPEVLRKLLGGLKQPLLLFLDAHWGGYCPLQDELKTAASCGVRRPVIVIHDFLVPGTDLGYDSYQGKPFDLAMVEHHLPPLYPDGYTTSYNDETAEGARRGILYVEPKQSYK